MSDTIKETLLTADQYIMLAVNLMKAGELTGKNLDNAAEFAEFLQEEGGAHLLGSPYKNNPTPK